MENDFQIEAMGARGDIVTAAGKISSLGQFDFMFRIGGVCVETYGWG